jgi:hypothetical protein
MGRAVSGGPECARCGCERAAVHLTALGVDHEVTVSDGKFLLDPAAIEEPESIQIEAVCLECGHVRFVEQNQWEWA